MKSGTRTSPAKPEQSRHYPTLTLFRQYQGREPAKPDQSRHYPTLSHTNHIIFTISTSTILYYITRTFRNSDNIPHESLRRCVLAQSGSSISQVKSRLEGQGFVLFCYVSPRDVILQSSSHAFTACSGRLTGIRCFSRLNSAFRGLNGARRSGHAG